DGRVIVAERGVVLGQFAQVAHVVSRQLVTVDHRDRGGRIVDRGVAVAADGGVAGADIGLDLDGGQVGGLRRGRVAGRGQQRQQGEQQGGACVFHHHRRVGKTRSDGA